MKTRLRHVAQINPLSRRFERLADDDLVPFLPMENVWPGDKLDLCQVKPKLAVAVGYTRFQTGDIVVPKITPTFEAGRSALIPGLPKSVGTGTTELHVVRPGSGIDPRYLLYIFRSHEFLKLGEAEMYGVAGQKRVPDDLIRNWVIDLPPLDEQRRIANFLDAETAKVDRIQEARRNQIVLLDTRETSLLDSAYNSVGAPAIRLKHLTSRITSGPRGWGDLISDEGTTFLRIMNISRRGIQLDLSDLARVATPAGHERERTRTRIGDIVVSITADIGSVGIVDGSAVDGNVSQHIALVRPVKSLCDATWLAYAIKSPAVNHQLTSSSYGGTKIGLGLGEISELQIPFTDLANQRNVASRINEAMADNEKTRGAVARQLALLAERRQALITAAVTGQIDVTTARGLAPSGGVPT